MRFILIALLVYLAYQFIFNFLIPLYIAARRIRKGFREMSAGMNQAAGNTQTDAYQSSVNHQFSKDATDKTKNKVSSDDYLDFEDVK